MLPQENVRYGTEYRKDYKEPAFYFYDGEIKRTKKSGIILQATNPEQSPQKITNDHSIVIHKISETVYHRFVFLCNFSDFCCPSCGGRVTYHGRYLKRFYGKQITILRVRCCTKNCRTTHAIIPSFSVPCCSTEMKEMDQFLLLWKKGDGISVAGQCFINAGMSPDYPEFIHKKIMSAADDIPGGLRFHRVDLFLLIPF